MLDQAAAKTEPNRIQPAAEFAASIKAIWWDLSSLQYF
jgi:hypothetical protein